MVVRAFSRTGPEKKVLRDRDLFRYRFADLHAGSVCYFAGRNGVRPPNVLCCVWFAPAAQPCAARSFGRARSCFPRAWTSERASVHPEWLPGRNRTAGHCRGRGLPGSRRRCLGDTGSIRRLRCRSRYPGTILSKRSQTVASGDPRIGLLPGPGDSARHPMDGGC